MAHSEEETAESREEAIIAVKEALNIIAEKEAIRIQAAMEEAEVLEAEQDTAEDDSKNLNIHQTYYFKRCEPQTLILNNKYGINKNSGKNQRIE